MNYVEENKHRLKSYQQNGFPRRALNDTDELIRTKAYIYFKSYTFQNERYQVRLLLYRQLGFTKEALNDHYYTIQLEACNYLEKNDQTISILQKIIEKYPYEIRKVNTNKYNEIKIFHKLLET